MKRIAALTIVFALLSGIAMPDLSAALVGDGGQTAESGAVLAVQNGLAGALVYGGLSTCMRTIADLACVVARFSRPAPSPRPLDTSSNTSSRKSSEPRIPGVSISDSLCRHIALTLSCALFPREVPRDPGPGGPLILLSLFLYLFCPHRSRLADRIFLLPRGSIDDLVCRSSGGALRPD